jgi:hypothetical protein
VHKGKNFSTSIAKPETDLTADMLASSVYPPAVSPGEHLLIDCGQRFMENVYIQEIQL